jgi:isoquinoline 1-oxidoreductase beta subunit
MHGTKLTSTPAPTLSRRHFILTAATAAGGFMIGIGIAPGAADAATVPGEPWATGEGYSPNDIDAWIAIDPDDSILIRYQRSEMGQGSILLK